MGKRESKLAGKLNPFQRVVANKYACGDFSYCETLSDTQDVGDGLFSFLMRELNDDDDDGEPMDASTANQRLQSAIDDLSAAANAVQELI